MAQIRYGANLSSTEFPFLSFKKTRSVIIPQQDQQYVSSLSPDGIKDKQDFIPDLYYGHNIMPTHAGWQSIAFHNIAAGTLPVGFGETLFDAIKVHSSINSQDHILVITSTFQVYITTTVPTFDAQGFPLYTWKFLLDLSADLFPPPANTVVLSEAFVNGVQYVFFAIGNGVTAAIYNIDPVTLALNVQALGGVNAINYSGIFSANGYMLLWFADISGGTGVLWSSTIDPTDFTPSLITGAGGGNIQEAQGDIVYCYPITGGFIVYTKNNIIAANYTQNAYYPFNFQEISNSGGIISHFRVAGGNTGSTHYAFTAKGLQAITLTQVLPIFPSANEFITQKQYESFNENTLQFTESELVGQMNVAVNFISGRYLVISYGGTAYISGTLGVFNYALVNDTVTGRWGKIKIDHSFIFTISTDFFGQIIPVIGSTIVGSPKNSFLLLSNTGAMNLLDWDIGNDGSTGTAVAIFGKYQLERSNMMQLETLDIEGIAQDNPFNIYEMYTIDGKTTITPALLLVPALSSGDLRVYQVHTVGLNHSLIFIGKFDLTTLILTLFNHGRR